ncbi:hypothetical protein J6590_063431 [Homalodisca vitripennis]|nr:hypothetical protein J6590_063431 [Homalodisca vitripennis]
MKRAASPLSDNAVDRVLDEDYLSDSFVMVVDIPNDNNGNNSSSESSSVVDDTDSDPDYSPTVNAPSTSGRLRLFPNLPRTPNVGHSTDDSSSDEDVDVTRPRGHPRLDVNALRAGDNDSSGNDSDWNETFDDQDTGFAHQFSFQELTGPKHCPPKNSSPIAYFRLFFYYNSAGNVCYIYKQICRGVLK